MTLMYRIPTGNTGTSNWASGTGGNKWDEVDDNVAGNPVGAADDDTTYILRADSGADQIFTFTAFDVPAGSTIASVKVFHRSKRSAVGPLAVYPVITVGGSLYVSTYQGVTTSYADYTTTQWTTNPKTTVTWTVDDVNGVGSNALGAFGVRAADVAAGETAYCTQVYCIVNYTAGGDQYVASEDYMWE